jgi:hypothetical protein
MGKHSIYFELRDQLDQPGCVVCRLAQKAVCRFFDHLLHENVNDPGVRQTIRLARGFCNLHAWQLRDLQGALGSAIIYRDVLEAVREQLRHVSLPDERARNWASVRAALTDTIARPAAADLARNLAPQETCPACQTRQRTEQLYLRTLLRHIDDPDIVAGLQSSGGLCLQHFRAGLNQGEDERSGLQLAALQLKLWDELIEELSEFIRKQDYRFRDESLEKEGDSWIRAGAAISGLRGVW